VPQRNLVKDIALYARVSLKGGRQETENQLGQLRRYVQKQGWKVTAEYEDLESGRTPNRPQFARLFEDARLRKFDLVLFWSLDRFSREGVLETLNHLQRLTHYGVDWKSYTEQYLDSLGPFRDAVLAILAAIAKQERVRISERTRAGLERARSQGKQLGRPRRVVDHRKILTLRKQGLSLRQIGAKLGIGTATVMRRLQQKGG
jgi:DNA invertase Pin-like site-specific DNA recombinase